MIQLVLAIVIDTIFSQWKWAKRNRQLDKRAALLDEREKTVKVGEKRSKIINEKEADPVYKGRLSANDFIEKMRNAEKWSIRTGFSTATMCREVELVVPVQGGKSDEREHYLGPDPFETDDWIYRDFIDAITEITGVSSSTLKFTANRIEKS